MKDGDRFLIELKQRAERVRKLHLTLTVLFLPRYEPDEIECTNYYLRNKN